MPKLPDADAQLEAIFRAFPDLLFVLDSEGTILDYRSGDARLLYAQPDQFIGRRMSDILPPDVAARFQEALEKAHDTRQMVSVDYPLTLHKKQLWFEARFVILPQGQIAAFIRDITAHKESDLTIRRQLDHLSALRSIDMAITSSLDIRLTLSILVNQVRAQLGVDAACILLADPDTQALRFASGDGFRLPAGQRAPAKADRSYANRAASTRQLVRITNPGDQSAEAARIPWDEREGFVDYFAVPLVAKARLLGVLEIFHRTSLAPKQEWLDFLDMLAGQAAIAIESAVIFSNYERTNAALAIAYDAAVEAWARALELRNHESEGHIQRVADMAVHLASLLDLPEQQITHIRRGAILHDIGNLALPDRILFKPGPLDAAEWQMIRQHTSVAVELLRPMPYLARALEIPEYHHEKWDGTGYPHGLRAEQIPLAARLFAVVDVFDAVTSPRPYRGPWTRHQALEHIRAESGRHFDPKVVRAFMSMMEQQGDD
ncbi:MAG: HD domain-containing phosphohydrolase [Bacteroidota bacterium]